MADDSFEADGTVVTGRPLRAIWDLAIAPITFDFGIYIAVVECVRQLRKAPSIDLTIKTEVFRAFTERDLMMGPDEKRWRLKSIQLDLCELVPTIGRINVAPEFCETFDFPES